jgi:Rab-GTPase-TBC domain
VLHAAVRGSVRAAGQTWEVLENDWVLPTRLARCARLLEGPQRVIDSEALRAAAWSGMPARYRTASWQMLLGYLPLQRERQLEALVRRKAEYKAAVAQTRGSAGRSESEQALLRQVLVDVPRTCPEIALFHCEWVQRSLERVLFTYAARHFATGYVQGLNDIATPFYAVFLSPWVDPWTASDVTGMSANALLSVEADVYWCMSRLLEGIQDHYTPSQPGIQRMIHRLRELVHRIDGETLALLSAPASARASSGLLTPRALSSNPRRAPGETPRVKRRGFHHLFIPLDELFAHARAPAEPSGAALGHVPRGGAQWRRARRLSYLSRLRVRRATAALL